MMPLYWGEHCVAHVSSAELVLHLDETALPRGYHAEAKRHACHFFQLVKQPVRSWATPRDDFDRLMNNLLQPRLDLARYSGGDLILLRQMMAAVTWGARHDAHADAVVPDAERAA